MLTALPPPPPFIPATLSSVAPATVCPEDLLLRISYNACRYPVSEEGLRAAGLFRGAAELASSLAQLRGALRQEGLGSQSQGQSQILGQSQPSESVLALSQGNEKENAVALVLPERFQGKRWEHCKAVAATGQKARPRAWEASHQRFAQGEHVEAIAMGQTTRQILPTTVVGHLLEALVQGERVELRKLGGAF